MNEHDYDNAADKHAVHVEIAEKNHSDFFSFYFAK